MRLLGEKIVTTIFFFGKILIKIVLNVINNERRLKRHIPRYVSVFNRNSRNIDREFPQNGFQNSDERSVPVLLFRDLPTPLHRGTQKKRDSFSYCYQFVVSYKFRFYFVLTFDS